MPESFLSAIALSRGRSRPLRDAMRDSADAVAINALLADDFHSYIDDERHTSELIAEAALATLDRGGVRPQSVDAVVIATESAWDAPSSQSPELPGTTRFRNDLLSRLESIGLDKAHPYGLGMASCADLVPALMLAAHAVNAGVHSTVLLVAADRQPRSLPRLMKNGGGVYSDIAVAALVTALQPTVGVRIGTFIPSARFAAKGGEPAADIATTLFAVRELRGRLLERMGYLPTAVDHVIAGNFLRSSLSVVTDTLGCRDRLVRMDSKPHIAHGHAADVLATLRLLLQEREIGAGQSVLIINSSMQMWNLACLHGV